MNVIAAYFDSLYDFARRKLDINRRTMTEYLDHRATARVIDARTVELSYTGDDNQVHTVVGHAGVGHTHHAARWVNDFNNRSKK